MLDQDPSKFTESPFPHTSSSPDMEGLGMSLTTPTIVPPCSTPSPTPVPAPILSSAPSKAATGAQSRPKQDLLSGFHESTRTDQQQTCWEADQFHECNMAKIRAKEMKTTQWHERKMLELRIRQSELEGCEKAAPQTTLSSPAGSLSPTLPTLGLEFFGNYAPNFT